MTSDGAAERSRLAALHSADVVDLVSGRSGAAPESTPAPGFLGDPWHTAIHEAGHAVVGRKLGLDMGQASAAQDDDSAGRCIVGEP